MRSVLELWRAERRSRWFFGAHIQGTLGVGGGYAALMVFAYERIGSAWAATAVLLADVLPSMLLGAFAAGVLLLTGPGGPEILLATNAATFIVLALLLARLSGVVWHSEPTSEALLSDTRAGIPRRHRRPDHPHTDVHLRRGGDGGRHHERGRARSHSESSARAAAASHSSSAPS
jgi:hypothetical protein